MLNRAQRRLRASWRWLLAAGVVAAAIAIPLALDGPAARAGSPNCMPSSFNRSAALPGTALVVSPLPGSRDASPDTQISLLGAVPASLSGVTVVGSRTGSHAGALRAYSQGDGASFVPSTPFRAGETVDVRGSVGAPGPARSFSFRFVVGSPDNLATPAATRPHPKPDTLTRFRSAPRLVAPRVAVTKDLPRSSTGDLFAAVYGNDEIGGPVIFSHSGELVWFHPLPVGQSAANLQVQRYGGHSVLTWWQGDVLPQGFGEGEDVIANASYRRVQVVRAGNGEDADLHDFQIQPHEVALLTVLRPIRCDLSSDGGSRSAALTDAGFQEIDMKTGLVRREWDSIDHVPLQDSKLSAQPKFIGLQTPFDYFHLNSLDVEPGGDLLLSARSTWALYTVDRTTGRIVSQIGGRQSSYRLKPGGATAYQHDARLLPNGTISVFDNGGVPMVHNQSRALVIDADAANGTVAKVREYEHDPELQAGSQGNVQLLPDGDVFVGWGSSPYFSEYTRGGRLVFDAHVSDAAQSYRVYRFAWSATPQATRPSIAARRSPTGTLTVYASWNGATTIVAWRVLAGASAAALVPVDSAPRHGFETVIATASAGPAVEVEALGKSGEVLGTSKILISH